MFASVIISAKAARELKEGYPWVFEGEFLSRRYPIAGIVAVLNKQGEFLGQAFYSPVSKIVLRYITKQKVTIDKAFWRERIRRAEMRRESLKKITNAYRVVSSESDGIPSVIVERYNNVCTFQITSAGAESVRDDIISAVIDELRPDALIEKNDTEVRRLEGLDLIERIIFGEGSVTVIKEGDKEFELDLIHGQKTGAYLDYRGFRFKAAELCYGDALDLFCYHGWLTCHIAGRAKSVVAVDASDRAIGAARKNAERNGCKNVEFICEDVFEFLKKCDDKFDLIHIDPPPFAKGRDNLKTALKGYEKLIASARRLLKSHGTIFISSCSHHITEGMLEKLFAGMECEIIYRGIQDKDHPLLKGFPESLYLKAIAAKF